MQITVNIPDELAAQVEARGLTPQSYVETWIAEQATALQPETSRATRLAALEKFLDEMAAHSDDVPLLPAEAFTRESIYQDHD